MALLACAPAAMEPVGYTAAGAQGAPAKASASASALPWKHAKAMPSLTKANTKRFPAAGHLFGRFDADILVNEAARAAYTTITPGTSMPVGALIVEVHVDHDGGPGPVFAMEKGPSGWTYAELDAQLHLKREGRLAPCAECHAHVASQDSLFGVPSTGR